MYEQLADLSVKLGDLASKHAASTTIARPCASKWPGIYPTSGQ